MNIIIGHPFVNALYHLLLRNHFFLYPQNNYYVSQNVSIGNYKLKLNKLHINLITFLNILHERC